MLHELPGSFSRSFVADLSAPGLARCALRLLNGHVDTGLLERARIVVSELVSNSVRHADLAPEQEIDVRVSTRRELLCVEVIDDGAGFEPVAMRRDHEGPPGGWGLRIVAQLTERWGVDLSHSTRVWCEFEPRDAP